MNPSPSSARHDDAVDVALDILHAFAFAFIVMVMAKRIRQLEAEVMALRVTALGAHVHAEAG
ncbi:MAG TPA: hypothetical protein VKQ71_03635 [Acidimicrobiales bacterium]|nr:hypothetical protein [Acidimicrobiales bacterium]